MKAALKLTVLILIFVVLATLSSMLAHSEWHIRNYGNLAQQRAAGMNVDDDKAKAAARELERTIREQQELERAATQPTTMP